MFDILDVFLERMLKTEDDVLISSDLKIVSRTKLISNREFKTTYSVSFKLDGVPFVVEVIKDNSSTIEFLDKTTQITSDGFRILSNKLDALKELLFTIYTNKLKNFSND